MYLCDNLMSKHSEHHIQFSQILKIVYKEELRIRVEDYCIIISLLQGPWFNLVLEILFVWSICVIGLSRCHYKKTTQLGNILRPV